MRMAIGKELGALAQRPWRAEGRRNRRQAALPRAPPLLPRKHGPALALPAARVKHHRAS